MADKGYSLRLEQVKDLRRAAYSPKPAVPAKDLELAITEWVADVARFEEASGHPHVEELRRLNLQEMCPEKLRDNIRGCGPSCCSWFCRLS